MRSGAKVAVVGGVFLVVAGGVAYGGYQFYGPDDDRTDLTVTKQTGPPGVEEVNRTTRKFLAAWAKGDADTAAGLTDNAAEARALISGFRTEAKVSAVEIVPGPATNTTVPFTVKATVTYEGRSKPFGYASKLTVVRGVTSGRALVNWQPAVVHPQLTKGAKLVTGPAANPPITAVDREGRELPKARYPSLSAVLDGLRERFGKAAGGTPGVELVVESPAENVPDRTLLALTEGKPGKLKTTIDAGVQAAAEKAVKGHAKASVVAIQPSTGEIRAVANTPAEGFNTALMGAQAPGSTMKIVSAAMMLEHGLVTGPDSKVECPKTVQWDGRTFENLKQFTVPNATFRQAFARSCNTTFIKAIKPLTDKGVAGDALGETARKYFGLGLDWKTGTSTHDGKVPQSTGTETAASYIGQGRITMNALNMASVAATVKNGGFKQPTFIADRPDRSEFATAEALPPAMANTLRSLMRADATGGSGQQAMAPVGGDKGSKTGSAEVGDQTKSNSWFTGFAGDLSAAAVVQEGGRGGVAAGPVVASVLNAR
ncbi:penicillin-binding transpeptidase domain-containing protein [Streptomyces qinzhouensis]|uniref:Penicillin-binding protein n=1 Tax=Streptomyces qinzhouensis TaxID=2599401 RepID=A0A5B8JB96_9ACTN|nr:penicillin-binding transpeptidase domain-containing protein [Streptomyces qinzhouensis]QDY77191.1 penicillin-binding protein [Streptomyces qinzhouensis]